MSDDRMLMNDYQRMRYYDDINASRQRRRDHYHRRKAKLAALKRVSRDDVKPL